MVEQEYEFVIDYWKCPTHNIIGTDCHKCKENCGACPVTKVLPLDIFKGQFKFEIQTPGIIYIDDDWIFKFLHPVLPPLKPMWITGRIQRKKNIGDQEIATIIANLKMSQCLEKYKLDSEEYIKALASVNQQ